MFAVGREPSLTALQSAVKGGVEDISQYEETSFVRYSKVRNPYDGSVFWVLVPESQKSFQGSLHMTTNTLQEEVSVFALNYVVFTTNQEISELNTIQPTDMWVCEFTTPSGVALKVGFSERTSFYHQAGAWHYRGDALYPQMGTQLVDSQDQIPLAGPIVSNSLPIWLAFEFYLNSIPSFQKADPILLPHYASYLIPDNIQPPYVAVHIEPDDTKPLGYFPMVVEQTSEVDPLNRVYETDQLSEDKVILTLFGLTNEQAVQYVNFLVQRSVDYDEFGFMDSPVIKDDKKTQTEFAILAMKKRVILRVSYYQATARAILQRLIVKASCSILIPGGN